MTNDTIFIGAMIIAIVSGVKTIFPQVTGAITILVAIAIGALAAIFAPVLGLDPMSVSQGILAGLGAVGVHTTATAISSKK